MKKALVVVTTTASQAEAQKISHLLLERKLAACVNILPQIESWYWWQGKIDRSDEFILLIKTTQEVWTQVRETIQKNHSYDLPEIIALPIDKGETGYLSWIRKSVKNKSN